MRRAVWLWTRRDVCAPSCRRARGHCEGGDAPSGASTAITVRRPHSMVALWQGAMPAGASRGRSIPTPRGKTLGGSSSINGHIYNRGQRADYDGWAQRGNRGWGYADILPYFRRSERRIGEGDDIFRGRDGPLTVSDINWSHPLCEAFIEGAVSLGIPRNPDYNGAAQEGVRVRVRATVRG